MNLTAQVDIFHGLHDISKWTGSTLGRRKGTTKRHLDKCESSLKKLKKEERAKQLWRPKWSRSNKPVLKTKQLRKTWITTSEQ